MVHALEHLEKYHRLETSPSALIFNSLRFAEKNPMLWQLGSIFWRQNLWIHYLVEFFPFFYLQVTKLGNLPDNIKDAWEFLGKPQHCRYTWDTQSNTNLNAAYKCKMRFDRIYFRPAVEGGHFIPRSMDLIGLEKLECGRFPSDHWGILCNFDVIL